MTKDIIWSFKREELPYWAEIERISPVLGVFRIYNKKNALISDAWVDVNEETGKPRYIRSVNREKLRRDLLKKETPAPEGFESFLRKLLK